MKNIIVAGAGIGGLVAGGMLASNGYCVTVYAKNDPATHGYDWEDCLNVSLLERITGKSVPPEDFGRIADTTYHNPSGTAPIHFSYNGKGPTKMERKTLSRYLLEYAENAGVQFVWNTEITGVLTDNARVTGICTAAGDKTADMVIDACGIDSPVRGSLPDACKIEQKFSYGDAFYAYRGIYERTTDGPVPPYPYEIFLVHQNEPGISWCVTEENCVDVLIGRFRPFGQEKVDKVLDEYRLTRPLGERRRGGQFTIIPVRRPLIKMVCDGYAAVGDSAYMTYPMVGSGIDLSMQWGEVLAGTILADTAGLYTTQTLWQYEYDYMRKTGKNLVGIDRLKNTMLNLKPEALDFFFEKEIITAADMASSGAAVAPMDLLGRAFRGAPKLPSLLRLAAVITSGDKVGETYAKIPAVYTDEAFDAWKKEVDKTIIRLQRDA